MDTKTTKKVKLFDYKIFRYLIVIFIIFLMLSLLLSPEQFINSATNGIELWAVNLLPALFPFLVFSKIVLEMDVLEEITSFMTPIMKKLFRTSGNSGYLFLTSIISGYPIGSKIASDAYTSGKISYNELHRIITFTSVSGPLFILGTVGISMLCNYTIGCIILASHILSAIFNGILYRNYEIKEPSEISIQSHSESSKKNILTDAVLNSIKSILLIGGLVCIFYVGMEAVMNVINLPPVTQGAIEITKGCFEISQSNISIMAKTIFCTGIITFGGFCTHTQSMYFLSQCGVSYGFFLTQKMTQTIFACVISYLLCLIFI